MSLPIEERFWSRVAKGEPDECWEWTGFRARRGYGRINYQGRPHGAHRIAYMLARGPIPEGLVVMHACDNPPCCNPNHLSVGTVADNNHDRHAKGRTVVVNVVADRRREATHCGRGHEYTPENTYYKPEGRRGVRRCRTCHLDHQRSRPRATTACPVCGKVMRTDKVSRHSAAIHAGSAA